MLGSRGRSSPTTCAPNEFRTTLLLKVFTERNFVADYFRQRSSFIRTNVNLLFVSSFVAFVGLQERGLTYA